MNLKVILEEKQHVEFEKTFHSNKIDMSFPCIESHDDKVLNIASNKKELNFNGQILFSEPKETSKNQVNPIMENRIKVLISKIRKYSYLNTISFINSEQIQIINDLSFYIEEKVKKNRLLNFFYYSIFIIKNSFIFKFLIKPIHPYGKFKLFWDFLNIIFIVFFLCYMPISFSFCFELSQSWIIVLYHYMMILDMIIHINTVYFDYGIEVKSNKKIIINYLKSGFFPDIFSFLSFYNLGLTYMEFKITKLLYLSKLLSLISINNRIWNRFQLTNQWKGIRDLLLMTFKIIFFAHLIACGWFFVALLKLHHNENSITWLTLKNLSTDDNNLFEMYLYSFYWAVITVMTVGYGDITPTNTLELAYSVLCIVLGCLVFGYSINKIGNIIKEMKKESTKKSHIIDIINGYMTRKNIHSGLQMKIREYLTFIWKEQNLLNTEEEYKILNLLSNNLKEELLLQSYGFFLKNNSLFTKNFSENTLRKLVKVMKEVSFTPDDIIFMQNEIEENPGIYFIQNGSVNIFFETSMNSKIIRNVKAGEYFGELSFFTNQQRENTAISDKFVNLIMIKQQDFLNIVKENSLDYETFKMMQEKIIFSNDYSIINKKCYSCKQYNHIINNCPKVNYKPNLEKLIKKNDFSNSEFERRNFFRRLNKKKTLFPLISKLNESLTEKSMKSYPESNENENNNENTNKKIDKVESSKDLEILHDKNNYSTIFLQFEKAENFERYFPHLNLQTFVKNQINLKKLDFEFSNHKIFTKYKNLKYYMLNYIPFLEKLYFEYEKKNKRKMNLFPTLKNKKKNNSQIILSSTREKHIFKDKFFDKNDESISFVDLVSNLIISKRKMEKERSISPKKIKNFN